MKILKRIFAVVALATAVLIANADDLDWMEKCPDKYLPAMTKQIISRESSVNQGEEAFMDFIPKFRTNKAFRNSRIKYTGTDEDQKEMFTNSVKLFENWSIIKGARKNTRCDKSWGSWNVVSADEICFSYNDDLPCDEWGGGGVVARFQRIDGKWYLTGLMIAG